MQQRGLYKCTVAHHPLLLAVHHLLDGGKKNMQERSHMYVWGTANPSGEANENYEGLYLRHRDIDTFVSELPGKPVKIEHVGDPVGRVVHAWKNQSAGLDCILQIDNRASLDGAVIASLIHSNCARELSLGYKVRMDMSEAVHTGKAHLEKEIVEVSIVKKGMRPDCLIHAHS